MSPRSLSLSLILLELLTISLVKMQSMKQELVGDREQSPTQVYMIFRVSGLGSDNLRAKIYLDPETLRQEGTLRFTPESYSVAPHFDTERENAPESGRAYY